MLAASLGKKAVGHTQRAGFHEKKRFSQGHRYWRRRCRNACRAGDRLVADLGLTSARWQILGAVVTAERPQPVAWLARDLGANRQNVQRIVNDLSLIHISEPTRPY